MSLQIRAQVDLVKRLYSTTGDPIFVPDTNALLLNTRLEKWEFGNIKKFTLVVPAVVLSELDLLKINHKNQAVRAKALRLINQIKDYRRRGSLADGVPLASNRSYLKTTAIEPDFEHSLPWLDRTNRDDKLLASLLEVMRLHPHSPVALVTADINLQNKAEFARLPFVEPPLDKNKGSKP